MLTTLAFLLTAGITSFTPTNAYALIEQNVNNSKIYYVDAKNGNNNNEGTINKPFKTLNKALELVSKRVYSGILSDKVYLREGIYKVSTIKKILYPLNIKGRKDHFSVISAMPTTAEHPGAIQRKSGRWYEKVVIDDGYIINTPWQKLTKNSRIWKTNPGYIKDEWNNSLIKKRAKKVKITNNDNTPRTTLFTVAPYMLLQDNEPLLWADSINEINKQGMRTYEQKTNTLYVRTFNDTDPNQALFESWYGGPEQRFRSIFGGNIEYTEITGIEFRLFTRLFTKKLAFDTEQERNIQKNVLIGDNYFSHGWMHLFTDVLGNRFQGKFKPKWGKLAAHFDDSSNWTVKNNVFYHPSREVFQVHGSNHIFENNDIIEHGGPWAGPMAFASAVNTRNTNNAIIRSNFIQGQGNNIWSAGSVFMIELSSKHAKKNNECLYGGQTIENNIFINMTRGTAIYLGRGGCVLKNITIRNNIFKTNNGKRAAAIRLTTPHINLKIKNNIFFDQNKSIDVRDEKNIKSFGTQHFGTFPSTIDIDSNIFSNSIDTIDKKLINDSKRNVISIKDNLFYRNKHSPSIKGSIYEDPKFLNTENLDFRVQSNSICIRKDSNDIGAYNTNQVIDKSLQWWNHNQFTR